MGDLRAEVWGVGVGQLGPFLRRMKLAWSKELPRLQRYGRQGYIYKQVSDSSDIRTEGISFRQFENIYDAPEHSVTGARTE